MQFFSKKSQTFKIMKKSIDNFNILKYTILVFREQVRKVTEHEVALFDILLENNTFLWAYYFLNGFVSKQTPFI